MKEETREENRVYKCNRGAETGRGGEQQKMREGEGEQEVRDVDQKIKRRREKEGKREIVQ